MSNLLNMYVVGAISCIGFQTVCGIECSMPCWRARHRTDLGCWIPQALSGLNFQKFKEAVENYTFKMTKPPQNDDAFQQVRFQLAMPMCI